MGVAVRVDGDVVLDAAAEVDGRVRQCAGARVHIGDQHAAGLVAQAERVDVGQVGGASRAHRRRVEVVGRPYPERHQADGQDHGSRGDRREAAQMSFGHVVSSYEKRKENVGRRYSAPDGHSFESPPPLRRCSSQVAQKIGFGPAEVDHGDGSSLAWQVTDHLDGDRPVPQGIRTRTRARSLALSHDLEPLETLKISAGRAARRRPCRTASSRTRPSRRARPPDAARPQRRRGESRPSCSRLIVVGLGSASSNRALSPPA